MILRVLGLAALAAALCGAGVAAQPGRAPAAAAPARGFANPTALRASELLGRRVPGVAPRILFEWDQVDGARGYVLQGRWVDPSTWALHAREFRVDARNARRWAADGVAFDVSLPPGAHSWTVVAVFGPEDIGDFAHPTHVSFDLEASHD
ncbi:MAG: hypothetical protein R2909_11700 [Gemmatimonadales bacterium]